MRTISCCLAPAFHSSHQLFLLDRWNIYFLAGCSAATEGKIHTRIQLIWYQRTLSHSCHCRNVAFISPLGIWLFSGPVSTSLPWSATSSSSDPSAHAAGIVAQQKKPKAQSSIINNSILWELRNSTWIRSRGDAVQMENNELCLVSAYRLICVKHGRKWTN